MEKKIEVLQKQSTINVQEKADLIWSIADKLRGIYKPHEYGNAILPLCVENVLSENTQMLESAKKYNVNYILINDKYEINIDL